MIGGINGNLTKWALAYVGVTLLPKVVSALDNKLGNEVQAVLPKPMNPPHLGNYIDIFV